MGFRALREEEREDTLKKIGMVKKELKQKTEYLARLEEQLEKGVWFWGKQAELKEVKPCR